MATAQDVINAAESHIGEDDSRFNDYYGWPRDTAWCANFDSYITQVDCGMDVQASASSAGFANQFDRIDDSEVQPADFVLFNWDGRQDTSWTDHIALVTSFDHSTGYFNTIDGNSTGGLVARNTYNNNSSYFTAFYRPNYDDNSTYSGDDSSEYQESFSRSDGETGEGIFYEVHTSSGWLGQVTCCNDTDDGYAGYAEQKIDGVRACRSDGQELRIQAIMDNGEEWSETRFTSSMNGENDEGDGYAGDIDSDHYIIGLRVFGAQVRVACANEPWFSWTNGSDTTSEGDDFAGDDLDKCKPITAIQMRW